MHVKGNLEKFKIKFDNADIVEINVKDIMVFTCSGLVDVFTLNSDFNEYECDFTSVLISKEADKFINQGTLKGTLFSVIKKNIINYFEIYTDKEKYKIYPYLETIESDYVVDMHTGKKATDNPLFNLAQTTSKDDDGNLFLIVSEEVVNTLLEEEE